MSGAAATAKPVRVRVREDYGRVECRDLDSGRDGLQLGEIKVDVRTARELLDLGAVELVDERDRERIDELRANPYEAPQVEPEPVADEDAMVRIRDDGLRVTSLVGEVRSKDDAVVKANPDAFRPMLIEPDLTPATALRAKSHMCVVGRRGDTIDELHAGQWVPRDSRWVVMHPNLFEELAELVEHDA